MELLLPPNYINKGPEAYSFLSSIGTLLETDTVEEKEKQAFSQTTHSEIKEWDPGGSIYIANFRW